MLSKRKKIFLLLFVISYSLLVNASAFAATDFMITWKAKDYAPEWYEGKILPTRKTFMDMDFELVDNGKIADLSNTVVRWYINGDLVRNENNGLGIKNYTLPVTTYPGNDIEVRITLPDYKGQQLDNIVNISVKSPEIVVDTPTYDNRIGRTENNFYLWPFFFNIQSLSDIAMQLKINGNEMAANGDPSLIKINFPNNLEVGTQLNIEANAQSLKNAFEYTSKKLLYQIK